MIGNSLTYTWGIPAIVEHLAQAGHHTLKITTHIAGRKGLNWHWTNPSKPSGLTAPEAIAQGGYDLVIVQGVHTPKNDEVQDNLESILPEYAKSISAKGMPMMLYFMGHPISREIDPQVFRPVIERNAKMADQLGIPCAPAALAFERCSEKMPQYALIDFQTDKKYGMNKVATHPSPFGSYLAACTIYAAVYKQSPVGTPFHAAFDGKSEVPIEPADAANAQQIAWEAWQEYTQKHPAGKQSVNPKGP